jgi:hypothetical protein
MPSFRDRKEPGDELFEQCIALYSGAIREMDQTNMSAGNAPGIGKAYSVVLILSRTNVVIVKIDHQHTKF